MRATSHNRTAGNSIAAGNNTLAAGSAKATSNNRTAVSYKGTDKSFTNVQLLRRLELVPEDHDVIQVHEADARDLASPHHCELSGSSKAAGNTLTADSSKATSNTLNPCHTLITRDTSRTLNPCHTVIARDTSRLLNPCSKRSKLKLIC